MVGGAAAVLTPRRALALGALLAALAVWDAYAETLPDLGTWGDVAFVAGILIPATFATVWLLLPVARARGLIPVTLALAVLALVFDLAGANALFNVTKLVAFAFAGFVFLELFQELSWVVLVAFLIPWVDALSVWRGPTNVVVEEKPGIFEKIAISFSLPGEDAGAALGPPDVLFFALFLATAARFRLRVAATWIAMTGLLSLTLVLTVALDLNGLPALPAIALGFLFANADLLWRGLRRREPQAG
ncbi:MAG TPA: hypothetical protein VJ689_08390 [Gaiellaceae bacterium]|nr:hypothetical protein [Gaiellaceae bacterium]